MLTTITCDSCGADIEVSKAFQSELTKAKTDTEASVRASLLKELETQSVNREAETRELREAKTKLQTEVLDMAKAMRALKDSMDRQELDIAKKLATERDQIKSDALKLAAEKYSLDQQELQKQLSDTKKLLAEATYKANQKSQQLQGEVMELDLERSLQAAFPDDDITPVAKGHSGGDVLQTVKGKSGATAGSILWETKRAVWSATWIDKLKQDARDSGAAFAILLTTNLPKDIASFTILPGRVIVAQHTLGLAMAAIVRRFILEIAATRQASHATDAKLNMLNDFLQSEDFRHRFESMAEGIIEMQVDLETEKRSFDRVWKKREYQIQKMITSASQLYGSLQGIMGNSLPEIKSLSNPVLISTSE